MTDDLKRWYEVHEGLWSPRERAFVWRYYGKYTDLTVAQQDAQIPPAARIIQCTVIYEKVPLEKDRK